MNITIYSPDKEGMGYWIAEIDEPTNIDPKDLYYIKLKQHIDIDEWCEETYGPSDYWGESAISGWKRMRNKYYFVNENDLLMFKLRWS